MGGEVKTNVEENGKQKLSLFLSSDDANKVLDGIYKYYYNIVLKEGGWREQNNNDNKVEYVRYNENNKEEKKSETDFQKKVVNYMKSDMEKDISNHYGHFSKGSDGGAFYKRCKIDYEDIEKYNGSLTSAFKDAFKNYTIQNNGSKYVDIEIYNPNRAGVLALGGIGIIGLILSGGGTDKKIDDGANNPGIIYTGLNVSPSDNNISSSGYNFNKYDENISDIEGMLNDLNISTKNCSDNASERLTFNNFIDEYDGLLINKTMAEKEGNVSVEYVKKWGRGLEILRADIEKYNKNNIINCSPEVNETKNVFTLKNETPNNVFTLKNETPNNVSTPTNKTPECSSKITEKYRGDYINIKDFFNDTECCVYENGKPKSCNLTEIKVGSCPGEKSKYEDLLTCNEPSGGSGGSGYVPPQQQPQPNNGGIVHEDTDTTQGTTGTTGKNNNNGGTDGDPQQQNPNGVTI